MSSVFKIKDEPALHLLKTDLRESKLTPKTSLVTSKTENELEGILNETRATLAGSMAIIPNPEESTFILTSLTNS